MVNDSKETGMHGHAIPAGCGGWQGGWEGRDLLALMTGGRGGRRPHGGRGGHHGRHAYGPPWGPPFGRGPRARRGDVRAAILVLLDEEPRNGYGLMQEIEQRSEGMWRPSPGSVYPALAQLEDEGLVRASEGGGRRLYELTDEGRAHVAEHREELAEPWAAVTGGMGTGVGELRAVAGQVTAALMQVAFAGSEAQVEEARKVLADTRRALYRILAEDDPGEEETGTEPPPAA
jgi:DNA-binding PadR family transcriptional regulator